MKLAVAVLVSGLPLTTPALYARSSDAAPREPTRLVVVDPLARSVPTANDELVLPVDPRAPVAKITARLWRKLEATPQGEVIPIIVTLYEAQIAGEETMSAADRELSRVENVARTAQAFAGKARLAGLRQPRALSHIPIVFGEARGQDLVSIAQLAEVRAIEDDRLLHATRAQGAALMRAAQLRTIYGGTGSGIGVAVVDTGVDDTHPELVNRVVAQQDFTGTTDDGTVDGIGHGTSVAGIIAGTIGGMAPQATLWAMKVVDNSGSGEDSWLLAALNSLYANRNSFGGLDLVNISLGTPGAHFNSNCDATFVADATAVNRLVGAGIAVFAAGGNGGFADGVTAPACLANAISVGAVYDANVGQQGPFNAIAYPGGTCTDLATAADQITCYSDSGNPLDLLAPAQCATTTRPGSGYNACFGGTSAASPYAAGVAAQLLSRHPGTTPAALRSTLMATGKPITDPGNGLVRSRVDAIAAHLALGGGGGTTAPCVRDAGTACLQNDRFEVRVDWQTATASGIAQVMSFGGQRAEGSQSVFMWFFVPTNFEMGLKILNACGLNQKYWVFISGLTDQGWTVHIRDTQTGATKTYTNAVAHLTSTTADTTALPCP